MIDQRIFEDLQTKIDEESTVRDVRLFFNLGQQAGRAMDANG